MLRAVQASMGQLPLGTVVGGDFRVLEALSSGGMGAVYVAEQISTGKRRALKLMHPSLVQDRTLRDRFSKEARVGSLIASDHVVEVVGAGVDPASGAPFIAMELLEGQNLAQLLAERGALSVLETREILRPLCHALGAAHTAGVVHRDVKPENVFLARTRSTSAPRSVKVLDFGIAKVVEQAHATSTAMVGTPLWMAPEQSEALGRVSPATDVWALGLVTFWMLTGRLYWRAAQAGAQSVHALLREVLFEPMEPASLRAQSLGVGGRIVPGFDGWFAGCVARDPAARFTDARAAYSAFARDVCGDIAGAAELPSGPGASSSPMAADATTTAGMAPTVPAPTPSVLPASATPPPLQGRSEPRSIGLLIGIAGVIVAFAAVAVAAVAVFFMARQPRSVIASGGPAPAPAEPPATASIAPQPSGEPRSPAAEASQHKAPAPKPSALPPKRPFDAKGAQFAVDSKRQWAPNACRNMNGPDAMAGVVTFKNDGSARASMSLGHGIPTARHSCVSNIMSTAHVAPFDGPPQSIGFAVTF